MYCTFNKLIEGCHFHYIIYTCDLSLQFENNFKLISELLSLNKTYISFLLARQGFPPFFPQVNSFLIGCKQRVFRLDLKSHHLHNY